MTTRQKQAKFLEERRMAYIQALSGPPGELILADLARFCRAEESCFHQDPRVHAVLEGRREVWLRIQEHLKLSPEELEARHLPPSAKRSPPVEGD